VEKRGKDAVTGSREHITGEIEGGMMGKWGIKKGRGETFSLGRKKAEGCWKAGLSQTKGGKTEKGGHGDENLFPVSSKGGKHRTPLQGIKGSRQKCAGKASKMGGVRMKKVDLLG